MKRFCIGICDDDAAELAATAALLRTYDRSGSLEWTGFSGSSELLNAPELPDIILLDIEMAEVNGLEAARRLRARPDPPIILFTTRHDSYAMQGYGLALRYLQKPLDPALFFKAMDAAVSEAAAHRMSFQVGAVHISLRLSDVLYLEAQGHYVMVHTRDSEYRVRTALRDAAAGLPQLLFASPHKSFLVNLEHIRQATADRLTLIDGTEIPISRSRSDEFNRAFYHFLGR